MYCEKCGEKLTDESKFCEKCGNHVSSQPQTAQADETVKEQDIPSKTEINDKDNLVSSAKELNSKVDNFSTCAVSAVIGLGLLFITYWLIDTANTVVSIITILAVILLAYSIFGYIGTVFQVISSYGKHKRSGEIAPAELIKKIIPKAIWLRALISFAVIATALIIAAILAFKPINLDDIINDAKNFERFDENITISNVIDEYIDSANWSVTKNTIDNVEYNYVSIKGKLSGMDIELVYRLNYEMTGSRITNFSRRNFQTETSYNIHLSFESLVYDGAKTEDYKAELFESMVFEAYKERYTNLDNYFSDNGISDLKNWLFAESLSQTYTNDVEGFTFKYPNDWTIKENSTMIAVSAPAEFGYSSSIAILKSDADDRIFFTDITEFQEEFSLTKDNVNMISLSDITLNGHSARKLVYSHDDSRGSYTQIQYLYIINYDMYIVTCTSLQEYFDKYEPIFDTIMDSYRITCSSSNISTTDEDNELANAFNSDEITNDEYVQMVKGAYRNGNPDLEYEKAFADFFGTPHWSYFKADSGENVVEFIGDCVYRDVSVKALIQFIVDEENGTFEATYLSFNEVPQDMLTKTALFSVVFGEESQYESDLHNEDSYDEEDEYYGEVVSDYAIGTWAEELGLTEWDFKVMYIDGTEWEYSMVCRLAFSDGNVYVRQYMDNFWYIDEYTTDEMWEDWNWQNDSYISRSFIGDFLNDTDNRMYYCFMNYADVTDATIDPDSNGNLVVYDFAMGEHLYWHETWDMY